MIIPKESFYPCTSLLCRPGLHLHIVLGFPTDVLVLRCDFDAWARSHGDAHCNGRMGGG